MYSIDYTGFRLRFRSQGCPCLRHNIRTEIWIRLVLHEATNWTKLRKLA